MTGLSRRRAGSMARKCGANDLVESTLPAAAAEMALVSSSVSPQVQQMQVDEQSSPSETCSVLAGYL